MSESRQDDDPFARPQGEQAGSSGSDSPGYPPPTAYSAPNDQPTAHPQDSRASYGQPTYDQPGYPAAPGYGPPAHPTMAPGYGYPAAPPTNGLAIASLVLSLAGLIVGFTAIGGVICGHLARRQIRERGEAGDGLALAGLIIGYIIVGLGVLVAVFVVIALALAAGSGSY